MRRQGINDFAELSRLTGVSQSQFSLWVRGKTQPSHRNLKRVAQTLGLKSPVTLYVAAGLNTEEDLELDEQVDLRVLPKPFQDLRDVYEQAKALDREDLVLSSISVLVAGLKVELEAEIKRRKPQPSGQRKQAS
jgi:transcriptional regulator with XRE-family HTH domain